MTNKLHDVIQAQIPADEKLWDYYYYGDLGDTSDLAFLLSLTTIRKERLEELRKLEGLEGGWPTRSDLITRKVKIVVHAYTIHEE